MVPPGPLEYMVRMINHQLKSVLIVFFLWAAGLGAAAQFGKMSVIYAQLGDIYPDHRGVGIGVMVSIIGIIGLFFGTTAGMLVSRVGPKRRFCLHWLWGRA